MDIYDPQTLGFMVFGGFMVISAIGIALVSTFSMKETSYEEALAKQRKELQKTQPPRMEKKKKDKPSEKKGRSKKKEDKPNGKLPEPEPAPEASETVSESEPEPAPVPMPLVTPAPPVLVAPEPPVIAVAHAPVLEHQPAPSPKDKKKREKKVAKVEPAPSPASASAATSKSAPVLEAVTKEVPIMAVPPVGAQQSSPVAVSSPAKKTEAVAGHDEAKHDGPSKKKVSSKKKAEPFEAPSCVAGWGYAGSPGPTLPQSVTCAAGARWPSFMCNHSHKAEGKCALATIGPVCTCVRNGGGRREFSSRSRPAINTVESVTINCGPRSNTGYYGCWEGPKSWLRAVELELFLGRVTLVKQNLKKNGTQTAADAMDAPLYLPYKTLVSTVSNMVFSEGEAQRLIEILTDKAGIVQDTWHTATQKGDPVAALKRQLEEKEKQLSAEQEDVAAAKNKLRELSKELHAEKSKTASVEARLKEQLSSRDQEIAALQARMQASYQDHVKETQQLNAKIQSLQEQLENGPNAQLARLQQENSILRDALNQATSQTESKQNAELAKLRQECSKLSKELSEKSEALQAEEQQRKSLETKVAAFEKQISQLQSSQADSERTLQKRLDEVSEELRKSQSSSSSLQAELEKANQEMASIAELQAKVSSAEAEVKDRCAQVESLQSQLSQVSAEKTRLEERILSIEALLEASQRKESENEKEIQLTKAAEMEQLQSRLSFFSLKEKEHQVSALEKEVFQLKEGLEQQKMKNNDLRVKNWEAIEALASSEKMCEEKLSSAQTAKDAAEKLLSRWQMETKETLQTLFPQIPIDTEQNTWLLEFKQKAQETLNKKTESPELLQKLKEAEESQTTLQAECEQYRSVLAETEGMLKDLQRSVEQEELVWKAKIAESEEELKKAQEQIQSLEAAVQRLKLESQSTEQLKEQVMLLEAQLEKQLESANSNSQSYCEEVAQLKDLLSESQSQLDVAKLDTQKQSEELALVRQHLREMKEHMQDGEAAGTRGEVQPSQLQYKLTQTIENLESEQALRQQLSEEFEQAQKSVSDLQAELDALKAAGEAPVSDTDDVVQLKERLEKEKKLTNDLGQAATKLQQLLRATQEQLAKEKETVRTLQEQFQGEVIHSCVTTSTKLNWTLASAPPLSGD
ncbi:RRBP1 protein, partial [Atractosteus spatula]|nr:RRBP1 protein [Atractosteus spatula]